MANRRYAIRTFQSETKRDALKRGVMIVDVNEGAIELRGELEAVAQAAWLKLRGENELGEVVDKKSPTRKEIMTLLLSMPEPYRFRVYEQFKARIKFTWMENV